MPGDYNSQVGGSTVIRQLLKTLHSSSSAVYGITVLQDELYIARDRSNVIEVFDVTASPTSLTCHRRVVIGVTSLPQQVRPLDITSCVKTRSLYISDAANCRIHRVEPTSSRVLDSWRVRVDARAWGISVTAAGTVLVCCRGAGLLFEYSSSGQLVRRIKLPEDVSQPVHAVEVASKFIVSHYDVDESAGARVCVVDDTGAIQRDHSQLRQPHHLAVLSDDARPLVAVADCGNDRVKLLDASTLNVVAVVVDGRLRRPHRLCVRQGRLYVGQWDGRVLIYQLSADVSAQASTAQPHE